ncbi:TPA: hypothetical protein EYP66_21985, partial [Candidatus Poribacteria bacterium]|nr:hypothetical protein [Candidatus Poribacteria bacterium]
MTKPKKACISFAIGCPRSMLDAARLVDFFKENGWKTSTRIEEADMVLVATCGVDVTHENKSMKYLSIADRKRRKDSSLIAFGCLPGINEPRLLNEFHLTPITRRSFNRLDKMINAQVKIREITIPNDLSGYRKHIIESFRRRERYFVEKELEFSKEFCHKLLSIMKWGSISGLVRGLSYDNSYNYRSYEFYENHACFNVRIATGCDGSCSYCALRLVCGPLISCPLDIIVNVVRNGLSKGYKAIRLIAEDVGSWGQDIGTDITALLRELFRNDESFKLLFDDFSPRWLVKYFPELLDIFVE